MSLDQNLLLAFALAQGGEFAFVLFSFATQHGVIEPALAAPLVAVVALSMAATPLLLLVAERLVLPRVGALGKPEKSPDTIDVHGEVIVAGFGRFGSVVGRSLRAHGVRPTVLEHDSDHIDVLRKLGLEAYYGDASRLDLLHAAGAERARALIVALDDSDQSLAVVRAARSHFPHLRVFARAVGRSNAYDLLDAGAHHVYLETLDTSLRLGVDVLRELGVPAHHALRSARKLRRDDERALAELGRLRHDRARYLSAARERIHDLEQSLLASLGERDHSLDEAWDSEPLRRAFGAERMPASDRETASTAR
jgi:voltage-gated potassium channel Kch